MTQITTAPVRRYDQEQQRIPNFLRVNGQAPREVQTQMEQAERQRRYTGGQIGEEGAVPSAWRGRAASPMARANKVHDEESFTQFFQQAMQDARRDDIARAYMAYSKTERSFFVTLLANRQVLDKQKAKPGKGRERQHVNESMRTDIMKDATKSLRMNRGGEPNGEEMRGAADDVYKQAARAMLSGQISDKDGKISERSTLYDLKLLSRAVRFLRQANRQAGIEDIEEAEKTDGSGYVNPKLQGGYQGQHIVHFHKDATHGQKIAATQVKDMDSFTEFYKSLRSGSSKNIAEFEKLSAEEKRMFIWALANPSAAVKSIAPARKSERHDDAKRQAAKQDLAKLGDAQVGEAEYRRAALMLLSEDGRYSKAYTLYNQPIVRDAMHFVRAAQMVRVDKLRKEHEKAAEQTEGLSGATKWSATNSIDVERGKMRIEAEKVKDIESFEVFLKSGLEKSGAPELYAQYEALGRDDGDTRSQEKILFIQGLSHRGTIEGKSDRSRIGVIQRIGNKTRKYSVSDEALRAQMVMRYIGGKQAQESGRAGSAMQQSSLADRTDSAGNVEKGDAWRAAVNLVSKDTQQLLGNKGYFIDVGMVQRAFTLVRFADKQLRAIEERTGGTRRATALRADPSEGQADVSPVAAKAASKAEYQAISMASRDDLKTAGSVDGKGAFEGFFQALMEKDENTALFERYSQLNEEQQALFVWGLSHRDVITRTRDENIAGVLTADALSHRYHDRKARDRMKRLYAEAGKNRVAGRVGAMVDDLAGLGASEYQAAALAMLSSESRRWNWGAKVTHGKIGDERLIERAFHLTEVAEKKRNSEEKKSRNAFMAAQGAPGEITRRGTHEVQRAADAVKDPQTFAQFYMKIMDKEGLAKYQALREDQKHLFIKALAHRGALDKKKDGQRMDEAKRSTLIRRAQEARVAQKNAGAEPTEVERNAMQAIVPNVEECRLAAYNILSSEGRALGKHRFLGIKFGAANEKLIERAFKLINESDRNLDELLKAPDRQEVMNAYGVAKLTHVAQQPLREQADGIKDLASFREFFAAQMEEKGKERFLYLYDSYSEGLKRYFIAAIAKYTESFAKLPGPQQDVQLAMAQIDGKVFRAAAYRLLEHMDGNSEALHFAMGKVSASIDSSLAARKKGSSYDSSKSDAELAEEMKLMQRIRMGPRSEFESAPLYGDTEHEKGSAVRRKIGETLDNVDRGISESYRAHVDSTRTALHNLNGKGKGDAVRRFFLKANPLYWFRGDEVDHEAAGNEVRRLVQDRKTFEQFIGLMGSQEGYLSYYNAVRALDEDQFNLLIAALNNRKMLDRDASDEEGLQYQDDEARSKLIEDYIGGGVQTGENAVKEAGVALTTSRALKGPDNRSGFVASEARGGVVDWDLLSEGLLFVQFVAKDEKRMRERSQKDARTHEVGGFGAGSGEGFDVMETGSQLVSVGSTGYKGYGMIDPSKKIHEARTGGTPLSPNDVREQIPQLPSAAGDVLSQFNNKSLMDFVSSVTESQAFEILKEGGQAVYKLVSATKKLIQSSVGLGMESAAMHHLRSQSSDYEKRLTLEEKTDIVQESLSSSFKMAKEMQAKDVNGKVFGILESLCSLATSGMSLAGIPAPITTLITKATGLLFTGAKWLVEKIIATVSGSRVDELLQVEKQTHLYNQRVKAYNAQAGVQGWKRRDLLTEGQMKRMLLRQSGLRDEKGALEYICRKNATCMVYAYGSKNRQDPDRLAAAQLFAGLKLPFQPGGKAPAVRDIIIKLRGAH